MAYGNFSQRCRGISQNVLRAVRVLTPTPSDESSRQTDSQQQSQRDLAQYFTRTTGYRLEYTTQSAERIAEEVLFQLQTNVSLYDAWVLDVPSSEAALRAGGVAALDELVAEAGQQRLQDDDVHPFLQKYGAMYGGNRTAIVLGGVVPLLYWRRDLFAAAGLAPDRPPATWEELLRVAEALNGTDLNGDGQPDAALCWHSEGCIDTGALLSNILASMTQYQGSSSGWLFRPEDMSPLAAGPPLVRALTLLRRLSRLEAAGTVGCAYVHKGFFNGSCAITIKSAQQFKMAQLRYPQLHGSVGVALLPGSASVWNRVAGAWQSCGADPATSPCPHATAVPPLTLRPPSSAATAAAAPFTITTAALATAGGFGSSPGPTGPTSPTTPQFLLPPFAPEVDSSRTTGSKPSRRRRLAAAAAAPPPPPPPGAAGASPAPPPPSSPSPSSSASLAPFLVNRAPFCGMTALLGSVDARTPPDYARAAFSFFSLVTASAMSWAQLGTDGVVGPFRVQHLNDTSRWLAMNYSREDLGPFLESYRGALEHPNGALPLRLPGAATLRDLLYWAAQQALTMAVNDTGAAGAGEVEADSTAAEAGGNATGGSSPSWSAEGLAEEVARRLRAALADVGLPAAELQRRYWASIGHQGSAPQPSDGSPGDASWFASRSARVGVGVAAGVVGCCLAALAGALWYRRRRVLQRRTLFGRTLAPGASPATSLVVTDIVDSTRLWETVSPAAMTRAVQLHHETLRSLLQLHNGYESATEGDAFILSFYSAADAVAFALRAQAALLYQPWPEELLEHAPCKPQYAVCRTPGVPGDRPRPAIPRLPRAAQHTLPEEVSISGNAAVAAAAASTAGASGPLWLHRGGGAIAAASATVGCAVADDPSGGHWYGMSAAQSPVSNSKLKLMSAALSLQLKRRPRPPYGAGAAGSRQLRPDGGGTTPQLTFSMLPTASMAPPPPPPPRDGFASQSLSQLLLMPPPLGDGSTGGGGGTAAAGGRAASSQHIHRHGAPTMRQMRLAMSRPRNASGSVVPFVRKYSGALSAIPTATSAVSTADADAAPSGRGPLTPTSARATNADITTDADAGGRNAPAAFGGVNAAAASDGGGLIRGGSDSNAAGGDVSPYNGVPAGVVATSQRNGAAAVAESPDRQPFKATATTAVAAAAYIWGSVGSFAPDLNSGTAEAHYVIGTTPGGHETAEVNTGMSASDSLGAEALVGSGGGGASGAAIGVATLPAPAATVAAATAAQDCTAAGVAVGGGGGDGSGHDGNGSSGGSGGGGGADSERISAATFSGQWTALGPAAAPPPPSATRAHASSPLPLLAVGTLIAGNSGGGGAAEAAAAARGGADGAADDNPESLLAVRGGDIRSLSGVESDPEPDRDSSPGVAAAAAGELGIVQEIGSGRRTRGSRFSRRTHGSRVSPAMGLVAMGIMSEAGLRPPPAAALTTAAAAAASVGGVAARGRAAPSARRTSSGLPFVGGVSSGSINTSVSLGLMPYRRMSVHNNLAALVGSTGLESGALNSGTSGGDPLAGGGSCGLVRSLSLGAYYQRLFQPCPPGTPGAVLVAGGLSVRMGVHSGVASTQVSYNRVAGRTQYSGAALEAAKAVCDAAQGGMVLLSAPTFEQLAPTRSGGASGGREPPHVVLHMGSHRIKEGAAQQELYMASSRELLARLAFLGPVRSSELVEPGVLDAPLGEVSMGVVVVVGLPTLMAWDKDATEAALATFRRVVVSVAMRRLGGHLVEEGQGRVLAAFGHPFDAIRWAAACEALLKEADWSEALLSHELAEEVQGPVLLDSHIDAPVLMGDGELSRMLFRGLRIRGAVDCAPVKAELLPGSGRVAYRGSLGHNVQRVAAYVSTGQVVCTRRAWRGYVGALDLAADVAGAADVVGACLGSHSIRGVGDKVELWSIRMEDTYGYGYEASYHEGLGLGLGTAGGGMGLAGGGGMTGADVAGDAAAAAAAAVGAFGSVGGGGGGALGLVVQGRGSHQGPAAPPPELSSPGVGAAAVASDAVGSRLGASLADTMAAQSRVWEMTGEELRNMLSE